MPEKRREIPAAELLNQRFEEHKAKTRLAIAVFDEVRSQIKDSEIKEFDPTFNAIGDTVAAATDSDWIISMLNAGIPPSLILKTWDYKDQRSRDSKELYRSK